MFLSADSCGVVASANVLRIDIRPMHNYLLPPVFYTDEQFHHNQRREIAMLERVIGYLSLSPPHLKKSNMMKGYRSGSTRCPYRRPHFSICNWFRRNRQRTRFLCEFPEYLVRWPDRLGSHFCHSLLRGNHFFKERQPSAKCCAWLVCLFAADFGRHSVHRLAYWSHLDFCRIDCGDAPGSGYHDRKGACHNHHCWHRLCNCRSGFCTTFRRVVGVIWITASTGLFQIS